MITQNKVTHATIQQSETQIQDTKDNQSAPNLMITPENVGNGTKQMEKTHHKLNIEIPKMQHQTLHGDIIMEHQINSTTIQNLHYQTKLHLIRLLLQHMCYTLYHQ